MKTKHLLVMSVLVILSMIAAACSSGGSTSATPTTGVGNTNTSNTNVSNANTSNGNASNANASNANASNANTSNANANANSNANTNVNANGNTSNANASNANANANTNANANGNANSNANTNVNANGNTSGLPSTGGCPIAPESGASITFSGWGNPAEQKVYRDAIDRFSKVCPGIKVNYTPIPDKFQDKMKAQMAGGTAPDVMYIDAQLMNAFAPSGQLLALDDLMSQAGVKASDFIPSLMKEFVYNGKTYGLPKDWGTLGLIYLPQAFKDAGVAEPTDKWTWTDMANAAKAIASKGKIAGFCMGPDEARFAPMVFSNGGSYTSPDYKTATLDTPEVTQMADVVAGMVKDKSLVKPADVGASWCGEAIGKQLAAMTTEGGWMVDFMNTTYPNVQYKAAEIPAGPKTRADYIFTNALGVNAATKYPKAAADLVFYTTGRTNQAAVAKTGFAYSTHPDQANLITSPIDQAISKGGLLADSKAQYWGPNTGKIEEVVSKALERVFLGQQSVADSFKQAQAEAQAALSGK